MVNAICRITVQVVGSVSVAIATDSGYWMMAAASVFYFLAEILKKLED